MFDAGIGTKERIAVRELAHGSIRHVVVNQNIDRIPC